MKLHQETVRAIMQLANAVLLKCALTREAEARKDQYTYQELFYQDIASEFYDVLWPEFDLAERALYDDPAVRNRAFQEVHSHLWQLVVELIKDRAQYLANNKALKARVGSFTGQVVVRSQGYEVAFAVERLSLPYEEVRIRQTTFLHLSRERAHHWGVPYDKGLGAKVIDHAVGLVSVHAGSFEKARELAVLEIDRSLDIMRAGLIAGDAGLDMDEFFLQRRGRYCIAKRLGDQPEFEFNGGPVFNPRMLDLREGFDSFRNPLLSAVRGLGDRVDALHDGTIPPKLAQALLRALEWVGSSVARENYDDRVVDLCTAMECMLTLESDDRKGEKIALRYIVLSGLRGSTYTSPHAIMPIYRRRSQIVHGAGRGIASPSDYLAMREIAKKTFAMVFELAREHQPLRDVGQLVRFLESDPDSIESALFILDGKRFKDDRKVEAEAFTIVKRFKESKKGPTTDDSG